MINLHFFPSKRIALYMARTFLIRSLAVTPADGLRLRVGAERRPFWENGATVRNGLVASGTRDILIDLTPVTYVDSATIGCLLDLYRQIRAAGGRLKLSGVQKRVETMLTMTGAHNFLNLQPDEASAVKSFGG